MNHYRRWECLVCGLVYDEKEGWPEDGIAPGTQWEDVPDDWTCPDCGVGKEDFVLLEDSSTDAQPQLAAENGPVVIIGTGLAGYGLAKEFRKLDQRTPLCLITSDDGQVYSKPMLSTAFTKGVSADDLIQMKADEISSQLDVTVMTNSQVESIDSANQSVKLADSKEPISYSKLVLALGSEAIRPTITGDAQDKIYSVNDLQDYQRFRTQLTEHPIQKLCIIGGGLIGCEFTNDLINGGYQTVTVDQLNHCLPTLLPEPAARAVQSGLEGKNAKFHFNSQVTGVNHVENGVAVSLDNGEIIQADLVLSAIGVRPRTALAKAAGIEINRGVVTNRLLQTSVDNIYAIGDCAEVDGHVMVYVAPLLAQVKALAKTLVGEPTPVSYPAMPVTIKVPACPTVVAPPAAGAEGQWSFEVDGQNVSGEFRNPQGELVGFALTGDATSHKSALQKQLPAIL